VYKFNGWYLDEDYKKAVGQSSIYNLKGDTTLYAKWSEEKLVLPSVTKAGYNFKGWYKDSDFNEKIGNIGEDYFPDSSRTIYAKFVDEEAPTNLRITNNSNGEWTKENVTVTLSASDSGSGIDHYEWYENGEWTTRAFSVENNIGTIVYTADRNVNIRFRAVDKAGNVSEEITTTVKIDKTAPNAPTYLAYHTSESDRYTSGTWTTKRAYTKIESNDAGVGIQSLQFSLDNGVSWTNLALADSGGLNYDGQKAYGVEGWALKTRNDNVYFRAVDKLGNASNKSALFNIRYDLTKPTISLNPNTQASYVKSRVVTVNLSDANSGLKASQKIYYSWSTSNTTAPSFSSYLTTTNAAGAASTSVTVPATSNSSFTGTYYLWIKSATLSDTVNNTSNQVVSALFKFDNTLPAGSISFAGSKGSVSINNVNNDNVYVTGTSWGTTPYSSASSSDGHSGVKSSSLSCSSNNTNVATVSNTGTRSNVTIKSRKGSTNSYHYLQEAATISCTLTVTDNAGNSRSVSSSALVGYANGLNKAVGWIYTWHPYLKTNIYFYSNSSGLMLRDWQKIGGYWYYLNDWCTYNVTYKTNSNYDYPDGGMIWNDTLIRTSDNSKWTFNANGQCTSGSGC